MSSYDTMAEAIDYLVARHADGEGVPDLRALAAHFACDPTAFQKSFQSYVGVSPKQLQRYMSLRAAREFLLSGYPTLEAAYEAGLSGNARLHEGCVTIDAATPGELKSRGRGVDIVYGWVMTPFGMALIAQTARGICWLSFELKGERQASFAAFQTRFHNATFRQDSAALKKTANQIAALWRGEGAADTKIKLNLYGTNFQIKVWEALLKIPRGAGVSYGTIANALGKPTAARAVGTAVGANPISVLIPCHRVIQQSGIVENYAWGSARKKVLLGLEGENPK